MLEAFALFLIFGCQVPSTTTSLTSSGKAEIEVTLIGNAGFSVRGPSHALVIDALLEPEETNTDHFHTFPPADLVTSLVRRSSRGPAIDLALVTHNHRDHVDSGIAASFLRHNPDAAVVAPQAVVTAVARAGGRRLERQLVPVPAGEARQPMTLTWPGGTVTAIPSFHSGHPSYVMENVLYIAEIDGVRLLHVGDVVLSSTSFAELDPSLFPVDVAFLPSWFVTDQEGRKIVSELFRPGHIVLMHVPSGRAGEAEAWAREVAGREGGRPPVTVLPAPGNSVTLFPR